jgi:hypothetical protein
MKTRKKLGEMLLEAGVIDEFQLRAALAYQGEWGGRLGSILIKKGMLSEKTLLSTIVEQYGIKSISLDTLDKPPDEALKLIKVDIARKFCIFPIAFDGKTLLTAMADPTDLKTLDDISFRLGVRIKPLLALESEIERAIGRHYEGRRPDHVNSTMHTGGKAGDNPWAQAPGIHYQPGSASQESQPKPDFSGQQALEGLIDLLIDKGVISKEELIRKLLLKGTPHIRIGD